MDLLSLLSSTTSKGNPNAWDVSKAYYDAGSGFSVAAQEVGPEGLTFKPDGTKMYIVGSTGDDINEYNLSTAWDISTASYLQNFSVVNQDTSPQAVVFKPDGTKMYVLGGTGDDVGEYNLSTAWDISTASLLQELYIGNREPAPSGIFFKPDGTKMYIIGFNGDNVYEYSLSSAWNISTASYVQLFSIGSQESVPEDVFFKPDGTKMYVLGSTGDDINEYDLTTAWDISTAVFMRQFSVAGQDTNPNGFFWKDDGTQFWIIGAGSDTIYSYLISPT